MPRFKKWSGAAGYEIGAPTIPNQYPSLQSVFPPPDQFTNTLLHVRFQPFVVLTAEHISGTNTPVSFAWDDIQIVMWTWLNHYDLSAPVDLGAFGATDFTSDTRILTVDTLTPLAHNLGTNPNSERVFYGIPGGVSAESRRFAFGAEDSNFSVDTGIGWFDVNGLFGDPLVVSGIRYSIGGRFMTRALWEGDHIA